MENLKKELLQMDFVESSTILFEIRKQQITKQFIDFLIDIESEFKKLESEMNKKEAKGALKGLDKDLNNLLEQFKESKKLTIDCLK